MLEYLHCDKGAGELPTESAVIRVQVHHAPWNPADVNTVQGVYPSPYPSQKDVSTRLRQSEFFPERTVAGSEGYGQIVELADDIQEDYQQGNGTYPLKVGDWVTFGQPGLGTMRSSLWLPREAILPIQRSSELLKDEQTAAGASTLFQIGGTALRMLTDFVKLKPGDTVIQNAGNSGVGFLTSQLAKQLMDVRVVSIIRRGSRTPDAIDALREYLMSIGGVDRVLVEEDLQDGEMLRSVISELRDKPPVLALNAVGGTSSLLLLKLLDKGGTHVTYGGMSKKPVYVSASQLIFKDVKVHGYWQSRWIVQSSMKEKIDMANKLVNLFLEGKLNLPAVQVFGLSELKDALQFEAEQSREAIRRKTVFDCQESTDS